MSSADCVYLRDLGQWANWGRAVSANCADLALRMLAARSHSRFWIEGEGNVVQVDWPGRPTIHFALDQGQSSGSSTKPRAIGFWWMYWSAPSNAPRVRRM